jgi:putative oxidoreductase
MYIGLFILRIVAGALMAGHGAQKLFGWFGGYGIAGTGGFFEQLGFRPGRSFAAAAGVGELLGGLMMAAGFLGPIGPAAVLATMIVAIVTVHLRNGVFASTNGVELPLLFAAVAAGLAFTGPGAYSLDQAIGLTTLWTPALASAAVIAGILGATANLAVRRPAAVEA